MSHKQAENTQFYLLASVAGTMKYLFGSVVLTHFLDVTGFPVRFVEAFVTAVFCGFGGILGKHVFTWLMKKLKTKKII